MKKKKTKSKTKKKTSKKKRQVASKAQKNKKPGLNFAYIGLGSNVGDREEYIDQAIFLLKKVPDIRVVKVSSSFETEAEGVADQPPFINAAAKIETKLDPYRLLKELQRIEDTLGRDREIEWGPRTIDLDILLYEDQIISDDKLTVPHPLLHERLFALAPLSEIAPDVIHPVLELTISDIYNERKLEIGATYDDKLPGFKEISKGSSVDNYEKW